MKEFFKTLRSIIRFISIKKKYWLIPVIITLLFLALLLFVFSSTTITPFIYTIF